jgi:hypothetical protein
MLIGYQIRNHGVDGPQISVEEVKESLRREIIAEFSKMNTGMERKENFRRELLMGAGQDAKENMNARDNFRRDSVSSVNIVIATAGDVASRGRQKEAKVFDS